MTRSKIAGLALLAVGSMMACALPLAAQDNNTVIQHATRFAISPPLGELAKMPQKPVYGLHLANPVRRIPKRAVGSGVVDPVEQSSAAPSAAYTVGANFVGVTGVNVGAKFIQKFVGAELVGILSIEIRIKRIEVVTQDRLGGLYSAE